MTKVVSVQSLPPLDIYTGEGSQAEDHGIDRWLERFDERAHLAEWSDEVKLYQLKVHLDKTTCSGCSQGLATRKQYATDSIL